MALITCKECGKEVSDTATSCPHCGCVLKQEILDPTQVCPETHLAKAILVTIFCCWPLGIPAIVNAASVSKAFYNGYYDLAKEKSEKANKWSNYSIIVTAVVWSLYFLLVVVLGVFSTKYGQ